MSPARKAERGRARFGCRAWSRENERDGGMVRAELAPHVSVLTARQPFPDTS